MSVQRRNGRKARKPTASVAFYDLDGTLSDLNLIHSSLFFLSNLGEWSGRFAHLLRFAARLPLIYLAEQRDRRLLNIQMFQAFAGISQDRLTALGEEYYDRVLSKRLYPQALELLEANRHAGLEPVLVTGSPDFLVSALARRLNIRFFAANCLAFRGGIATGRLQEPILGGAEKAAWCAEFAGQRKLTLEDCWGYSDSHHDLPFLAALGHPVAVNPDRKLHATAMSRQWPILRFQIAAGRRSFSGATNFGEQADGSS
jgi:fatty acyl-CoA reductase